MTLMGSPELAFVEQLAPGLDESALVRAKQQPLVEHHTAAPAGFAVERRLELVEDR